MCVFVCRLGPSERSCCYGFPCEDAITPAPALSITGVCLIVFPPSMLEQATYIINVAVPGKKRKKCPRVLAFCGLHQTFLIFNLRLDE